MLEIKNLSVAINQKKIIHDFSSTFLPGHIYALLGPNGSGKSSLTYALLGHPRYEIQEGTIQYKGIDLLSLPVVERARLGIFVAFQYPVTIAGVKVFDFLKESVQAVTGQSFDRFFFKEKVKEAFHAVGLDESFLMRNLYEGFSGGQKKRLEIVQMILLCPQYVILDEIDSGLDSDGIERIVENIATMRRSSPMTTFILITHYQRLLQMVRPDVVAIMKDGSVVARGDYNLALEVQQKGYDVF